MQNAGQLQAGTGFRVGAQAGVSNRGGLLRTDVSYSSYRFSGYATAIMAAQTFPLNQAAVALFRDVFGQGCGHLPYDCAPEPGIFLLSTRTSLRD